MQLHPCVAKIAYTADLTTSSLKYYLAQVLETRIECAGAQITASSTQFSPYLPSPRLALAMAIVGAKG